VWVSINRSTTDQIFCIRVILEEDGNTMRQVNQLLIHFKKIYDSVRRDVLCNILLEFRVPIKLVRLIKMRLNETFSKVHIGNIYLIILLPKMG
jgi:hypothetical protein